MSRVESIGRKSPLNGEVAKRPLASEGRGFRDFCRLRCSGELIVSLQSTRRALDSRHSPVDISSLTKVAAIHVQEGKCTCGRGRTQTQALVALAHCFCALSAKYYQTFSQGPSPSTKLWSCATICRRTIVCNTSCENLVGALYDTTRNALPRDAVDDIDCLIRSCGR